MGNAILASTVALNGGDAAIAKGALQFLKQSFADELRVRVLDDYGRTATRYHPELNSSQPLFFASTTVQPAKRRPQKARSKTSRLRRKIQLKLMRTQTCTCLLNRTQRSLLRAIVQADLIAGTGGTYLVDHYNWGFRLYDYEVAMRAGRPIAFLTQSMGPFLHEVQPLGRLARLLEYAHIVMVRDEPTVHAVQRIAPRATVHTAPDMAFNLTGFLGYKRGHHDACASLRMAVSVREWGHFHAIQDAESGMMRYMDMMSQVVEKMVEEVGAEVVFLSTCQGVPEYRYDDSQIAERVVSRLPRRITERVRVDKEFHKPEELIRRYAEFDVVIATRMHAAILAWIGGTPTVAISYERKTEELFRRHGLEDLVHSMEDANPSAVFESVLRVLGGRDDPEAARERSHTEREGLADLARRVWHGLETIR
jgi:colanic acid/amylovoran biosynthesis protein